MVCDECAREKDSCLPLIFNERVLQEFGCNDPERRMHFIVYLLQYQNHKIILGFLGLVLFFYYYFLLLFLSTS